MQNLTVGFGDTCYLRQLETYENSSYIEKFSFWLISL